MKSIHTCSVVVDLEKGVRIDAALPKSETCQAAGKRKNWSSGPDEIFLFFS